VKQGRGKARPFPKVDSSDLKHCATPGCYIQAYIVPNGPNAARSYNAIRCRAPLHAPFDDVLLNHIHGSQHREESTLRSLADGTNTQMECMTKLNSTTGENMRTASLKTHPAGECLQSMSVLY
jgi:hypothetical protein